MTLRLILAFAAGLALAGPSLAQTTPAPAPQGDAPLRQSAIDWCKGEIAAEDAPKGVEATCTCMIDSIITDFGPEAPKMLKVLIAGLDPSDLKEIAALLGITEAEAKAFVEAAEPKLQTIQTSCVAG